MLNIGHIAVAVMEKFGVKRRTVTKMNCDGKEILKRPEEVVETQTKTFRPAKYPQVEKRVLQIIELAGNAKFPVTRGTIRERALLIKQLLVRCSLRSRQGVVE